MSGINLGRWLTGGISAGVVIWMLEAANSIFYRSRMDSALASHGLAFEMDAGTLIGSAAACLLAGLVLVFLYAAARPRFGPGPRAAAIVALAFWAGPYVLNLAGYYLIGLFPLGLLAVWAALGLVELLIAAVAGAWMYMEP